MGLRNRLVVWGLVGAMVIGCAGAQRAEADGEAVSMQDAPAAVQATIRRETSSQADAEVSIERMTRGRTTLYEVEIKDEFQEREFLVDERGNMVRLEDKPD